MFCPRTQESWLNSTSPQMSEEWRVSVWRSAKCDPHTPDIQLDGHTRQSTLPVLCYIPLVMSRRNIVNRIHSCLELCFARTGISVFVLYRGVCFPTFSHLSTLTRPYPAPPADVFFTDDLLWISNLQCSDCYRQQQCFSRAVKAELPSPLSASVTPPCHALVSL